VRAVVLSFTFQTNSDECRDTSMTDKYFCTPEEEELTLLDVWMLREYSYSKRGPMNESSAGFVPDQSGGSGLI